MLETGELTVVVVCHAKWFNAEAFYALSMARLLKHAYHRVLMCVQTGSPLVSRAHAAAVPVFEVDLLTSNPRHLMMSYVALRRKFREVQPDIITAHRSESLFWGLLARYGMEHCPPIVRFRGDPRPPRASVLNKWLYGYGCARVVLSGNFLLEQLQMRLGLPLEHVCVLHAPVDTERFKPIEKSIGLRDAWRLPPHGKLLGVVGRIGRVKGHVFFLDMLQSLPLQNGKLHSFIAYHEEHAGVDDLRNEIHLRGLDRYITLIGPCENIEQLIAQADIGVISSIGSEANCRAALEFMACGVPLVATSVGVIPEVVVDGITGYLLPPAKPQLTASKVHLLLENDNHRQQLGLAARRRAKEYFSEAVFAAQVETLFLSLVRFPEARV